MPKPEVIGTPVKINVRISGRGENGSKESVGFEVYGVSLKRAETQVRAVLSNLAAAQEESS
ncbi:MAG: hypothetical protein LN413_00160 [Candidatus Thermoplasmatota archaeon]|nr:hypothetical protein [Candidatus Thermoplasmatota archaeon]